MKKRLSVFLLILISILTIQTVSAAITVNIVVPTAGWNNNYNVLLNVTTNDNANVTFNTSVYASTTTLFTSDTQGSLTLKYNISR